MTWEARFEDYDPRDKWKEREWTLYSDSLFSNHGFDSGALFDDLCLDPELAMPFMKDLLKSVVETFLLPQLGVPVELYDANTANNRVRADDSFQPLFDPISIVVTGEDIFKMLDEQSEN